MFKFYIILWNLLSCCYARNIGSFWHVTDLHYDDRYSVKGNPEYMCWEIPQKPYDKRLGKYGDYNCDSPKILMESAISAMRDIYPDPDFILWTGDDTTHVNDSFFSTDIVFNVISDCTEVIERFFPNTLVLPIMGNHDLYPQNQIAPGKSELQTKVADRWKRWLDDYGAYEDFEKDGRYEADIPNSKVTFVGLNTLLWYESNKYTGDDPTAMDPAGQFAWANQIMKRLEMKGRKIYLMGHIPPGMFERYFDSQEGFHWYQPRYNEQYIKMVENHSPSSIVAQFFGHHHTDSFRIFTNKENFPLSYALIAPAVTPVKSTLSPSTGANNPAIRLITYDKDTGEVLEVTTYYLDLAKANLENRADWMFEYNLTDILDLNEINAKSLYDATNRLKTDTNFFDTYYPVNTVQLQKSSECSEQCRLTQLCSITNIDYNDYFECNGAWKPIYASFIISLAFSFLVLQKCCFKFT